MTMSTIESKSTKADDLLVAKEVFVQASPERAFDVFTKQMGLWWPLATHHIGAVDPETAVVEPFVGGRWFEKAKDGSDCDWGRVLAWDPPSHLALSWQITAEFKYDAALYTEVDVRFVPENGGTRVMLEHRLLRAFGPRAEEVRGIFESPGGWPGILTAFATYASAQ